MVITSAISIFALGATFALVLGLAKLKLHVEEDPRVMEVLETLPGVDCGACGFASCYSYAEAVAINDEAVDMCIPGGPEVAQRLADIMGMETPEVGNKVAVVRCGANDSTRKPRGDYHGIGSCLASALTTGGNVGCCYGCLGLGDCYRACPFDAIEIVNGLPKIDPEKCTACGKCVAACPRRLIRMHKYQPSKGLVIVACSSLDRGPAVKKFCPMGCIACRVCVKKGAEGLFSVEDNLSRMNYDLFNDVQSCQEAIETCPTRCILEVPTRRG